LILIGCNTESFPQRSTSRIEKGMSRWTRARVYLLQKQPFTFSKCAYAPSDGSLTASLPSTRWRTGITSRSVSCWP